jgi:hypothetical protein
MIHKSEELAIDPRIGLRKKLLSMYMACKLGRLLNAEGGMDLFNMFCRTEHDVRVEMLQKEFGIGPIKLFCPIASRNNLGNMPKDEGIPPDNIL